MDSMKRRDFCKATPCAAAGFMFGKAEDGDKRISSVVVKVKSQEGSCGMGHKPGDLTTITQEGVDGKICIHALYSMLPAVFAMMYGARFPWLVDPDTKTHACPDAYNPVVFEITRIWEKT